MAALDEILAALTPQRLEQVILELAAKQPPGERAGVDVSTIIMALLAGRDLGQGAARSQNYQRLREAIRANVALIPGLKYVPSSD